MICLPFGFHTSRYASTNTNKLGAASLCANDGNFAVAGAIMSIRTNMDTLTKIRKIRRDLPVSMTSSTQMRHQRTVFLLWANWQGHHVLPSDHGKGHGKGLGIGPGPQRFRNKSVLCAMLQS